MASYRYTVTVQEPSDWTQDSGGACEIKPEPIVTRFSGARGERPSAGAIDYARAQHRRPDGTTVTITRVRLGRVYSAPAGTLNQTGPEEPYRRYVVQGGIVRKVDR